MIEAYRLILEKTASKKQENEKFFERLKKKKPTDLDRVCNELHDEVFQQIDCLQCANCCSTTGPLLLSKDTERLSKALKLKPSEFADRFLRVDEDGDAVFKSMSCPFLGTDHYCSVYEARPNACREFPHTQQRNILQKLKITAKNTMICPAVALITEELKKKYA